MSTTLPIRGFEGRTVTILGRAAPAPNDKPETGFSEVSPGFFQTMKIPLKRGRYLRESDTLSSPWVVVITEALARRYFPNEDPIGHQLLLGFPGYPLNEDRPRQIVGVIADVKQSGLGQSAPPFLYTSFLQQQAVFPGGNVMPHLMGTLVIRTTSDLAHQTNLTRSVKQIVARLDPDQPVTDIMTMQHALAASISDWRLYLRLLGSFAAMALLLTVIGIYGVMSYFVDRRTHEIGIRMALGARRADVLAMIATLGLRMAAIGTAIGAALALGLTQLIKVFLYGVKPTDPLTYAIGAIALVAVALLACLIPAVRAIRVDPIVSLRYE